MIFEMKYIWVLLKASHDRLKKLRNQFKLNLDLYEEKVWNYMILIEMGHGHLSFFLHYHLICKLSYIINFFTFYELNYVCSLNLLLNLVLYFHLLKYSFWYFNS